MTSHPDLASLIESLISASVTGSPDERRIIVRAAIEALQPRDAIEAMLVARMLATQQATMDSFQRAMRPGVSGADAQRLCNSAGATGRSFDEALRMLTRHRAAADNVSPAPQPRADSVKPMASRSRDVPRDESGKPVTLH
jgi:hypothetical protein